MTQAFLIQTLQASSYESTIHNSYIQFDDVHGSVPNHSPFIGHIAGNLPWNNLTTYKMTTMDWRGPKW